MKQSKRALSLFLVVIFLASLALPMDAFAGAKLNVSEKTMYVCQEYRLKLEGTTKEVKWTSSNSDIASVDNNGLVLAKAKGSTTITAKLGNASYKCKLTIKSPKINQKRVLMFKKTEYKLKMYGPKALEWKSSDTKIAKVDENGVVTAIKAGSAKITCLASNGKKYKCEIVVSPADPNKKMIAITFDDGPGYNSASNKICDTLEKYNVRATFFMVGSNAKNNAKNVKRKVALGCQIGNHTMTHEHYGKKVTKSDIVKASNAIEKACGVRPTAFRSPGGTTNDNIRSYCKAEGMPLYYWTLDTRDWESRNATKVYNAVIKNVKDGDIILMHEIYGTTATAFEKMVPVLKKKGYQFVTCEELVLAKSGKRAKAGTQYLNGKTIKNTTR